MLTVKGLIFDLDGVITDSAEYHYQAWKNLAEKLGIQIDREFNEQLKGISRMDSLERILVYGNVADQYSEAEKEILAAEKNNEYVELIKDITPKDLLPGIGQLLHEAKAAGIKLALASASKNGPMILARLEIAALFEQVVDPSLLAKGKPDPEIFMRGAEQLALSPEVCVGIEDAEAGISAINAAGMFSVGVGDEESMKAANYRVRDTSELTLAKIIQAWENK